MGDAILPLFGAPIAHGDDPQRAVLARLDIVQGIRAYPLITRSSLIVLFFTKGFSRNKGDMPMCWMSKRQACTGAERGR